MDRRSDQRADEGRYEPRPLDDDARYAAMLTRDPRFDGVFFVGVSTTGIYCRPICPARTPGRARCTFYDTPAQAEAAGYRACFRCRPELAPGNAHVDAVDQLVAAAAARIAEGAMNDASVEDLAAELGVSARHLRRAMEARLGVTPVALAQSRRLGLAKQLLQDTGLSLTEIAFAAGFGSVRRFNAVFSSVMGSAPSQMRRRHVLVDAGQPSERAGQQPCDAGQRTRGAGQRTTGAGQASNRAGRQTNGAGRGLVLRLDYRPPFEWQQLLAFLRARAIPGVEVVDGDVYRRVVYVDGIAGTIAVRAAITPPRRPSATLRAPAEPGLSITPPRRPSATLRAPAEPGLSIAPPRRPSATLRAPAEPGLSITRSALELELAPVLLPVVMPIVARVRKLFDLDARPDVIARVLGADRTLGPLVAARPGLRVPGAIDGFEAAVRALLGQQVSVAAATTLAGRFVAAFGERLAEPEGTLTHRFPTAAEVARVGSSAIAAIGMPGTRASALHGLAQAVASGALRLDGRDLDAFVAAATALPGIGPWTAHYLAMRALHVSDAFPAADLGIRKALGGTPRDAEARAAAWRPFRSYAVMHLWTSLGGSDVDEADLRIADRPAGPVRAGRRAGRADAAERRPRAGGSRRQAQPAARARRRTAA